MAGKPQPKGVRSMLSLTAEFAASDEAAETHPAAKGLRLTFLPFARIGPFHGHPFRLYTGERLEDMVESIRQNGILMPLIVRRSFDCAEYDYEMLSGHNRMNAGQIAGLEGAWCMVKEGLTEEEALMYVIETNVLQRSFSDLLPSEKAAVLSMRYSKMFSQGKRNDIIAELSQLEGITMETETCGSDFHRSRSRDTLGTDYDLTGRQIATYLRLDHLNDALKARLDAKLLTLASGVSLSYLDCDNQQLVAEELERWGQKLSDMQALTLRACLKSPGTPSESVFFRPAASKMLGIHPVFLRFFPCRAKNSRPIRRTGRF